MLFIHAATPVSGLIRIPGRSQQPHSATWSSSGYQRPQRYWPEYPGPVGGLQRVSTTPTVSHQHASAMGCAATGRWWTYCCGDNQRRDEAQYTSTRLRKIALSLFRLIGCGFRRPRVGRRFSTPAFLPFILARFYDRQDFQPRIFGMSRMKSPAPARTRLSV